MLYADWLLLAGSWRQTIINIDDRAPATGLSLGIFYFVGVVFGVSAGIMLLYDLFRGRLRPGKRSRYGRGHGNRRSTR